jgi:hypothetical protein
MWPFVRGRSHSPKRSASPPGSSGFRLPVRVIGSLRPGYLRVRVGAGVGPID